MRKARLAHSTAESPNAEGARVAGDQSADLVQATNPRDHGRFVGGNTDGRAHWFRPGEPGPRLTHGARSAYRWRELLPVRSEWRRAWLAEKGWTEADVPLGLSLLIDSAIELRLKAASYFESMVDGPGPVTAKGRRARIAEHHRREVEAFARVVSQIGLEREARRLDPIDAVRAAVAEANR